VALIVDPQEREIEALRRLTPFDGLTVLDVGCGEGRATRRIARTAASVVGIDPDADRIATARATPAKDGSGRIRYLVEDVTTYPLPTGEFDAVVFSRSL
jgi:2-polyprenyl-3-methyl-5-hydroxy-6-metoxy-1,4-benzoquinol methylase